MSDLSEVKIYETFEVLQLETEEQREALSFSMPFTGLTQDYYEYSIPTQGDNTWQTQHESLK